MENVVTHSGLPDAPYPPTSRAGHGCSGRPNANQRSVVRRRFGGGLRRACARAGGSAVDLFRGRKDGRAMRVFSARIGIVGSLSVQVSSRNSIQSLLHARVAAEGSARHARRTLGLGCVGKGRAGRGGAWRARGAAAVLRHTSRRAGGVARARAGAPRPRRWCIRRRRRCQQARNSCARREQKEKRTFRRGTRARVPELAGHLREELALVGQDPPDARAAGWEAARAPRSQCVPISVRSALSNFCSHRTCRPNGGDGGHTATAHDDGEAAS